MTGCGAGPVVLAATQTGGSHEASGVPCQDAYAWAEAGCGVLVIAVSDGVGTAPRSDEGAAGAVVAEIGEDLALVSGPDHGEYVNEVVPLTASTWLEGLRVSSCVGSASAVAVFTDGCERAALRREPGPSGELIPHRGFFLPLFAYGRSVMREAAEESELSRMLASAKMAESSDDDKTLVLAILDRRAGAAG